METVMQRCFEEWGATIPYMLGAVINTPILLGNNRVHEFFIFGCILCQIISISILILLYYNQLTLPYIWWLIIEFIRICIGGIIRIDRIISTEPSIFFPRNRNNLYKIIAILNLIGFIWAFPIWIFYVTLSLSNDEVSIVFFVVSLLFISMRIISSIPSISKLLQLSKINRTANINQDRFADSFLSASIDDNEHPNDTVSPQRIFTTTFGDKSEDDPIMYTAPMPDNMLSMDQLIEDDENNNQNEISEEDIPENIELDDTQESEKEKLENDGI
eukprot:32739_1